MLLAAIFMGFWSTLGDCHAFCSLLSMWNWRSWGSFGVWGGFSSPLTWLSLFLSLCSVPEESRCDSSHLEEDAAIPV